MSDRSRLATLPLGALRAFDAAARLGSFKAAALDLAVSLGHDRAAVLAGMEDPAIKERLRTEVQRAMGFQNEKDHPEVAPSQFEMNFSYSEVSVAADQVQLYKLIARQVAARHECTASFLPKPVTGVNGSGMHTNISLSRGGEIGRAHV